MLTDQSMPKMTGIELSEKAKILFPKLPIILSSGYGDEIIEQNIKNAGINYFHKKSANPEELIDAITELL
jgi:CheY-like chemotaxis protein